jgi:hypothetical protein
MVTLKPFEKVSPGDIGSDFIGESGTVIATGTYSELEKYDSTGACHELEEEQRNEMVAIKDDTGVSILYVYGPDGFGVYIPSEEL